MNIDEAMERARSLRRKYEVLETRRYGRPWTIEEIALGFVGDVGDLAKLIQASAGVREFAGAEGALAHELADCLWSILILADKLDVDIEQAFRSTIEDLTRSIDAELGGGD